VRQTLFSFLFSRNGVSLLSLGQIRPECPDRNPSRGTFEIKATLQENSKSLPLQQMTSDERLIADYSGTDLTIGKHPMEDQAPSAAQGKGPGPSFATGKQRMLWKAEREDI
jgi:hypothetical protein